MNFFEGMPEKFPCVISTLLLRDGIRNNVRKTRRELNNIILRLLFSNHNSWYFPFIRMKIHPYDNRKRVNLFDIHSRQAFFSPRYPQDPQINILFNGGWSSFSFSAESHTG